MTHEKSESQQDQPYFNCTAIIVAGGQSRRMGTDKTLLPMGQIPLIEFVAKQVAPLFAETLISSNTPERFKNLPFKVVVDQLPGKGPIMGLISTIQEARHDICFVQACDIPHTNVSLVKELVSRATNCDAVVPKTHDGHYEPLFAVYRKSALPAMMGILEKEHGRCSLIPDRCNSIIIELKKTQHLRNLNTPRDYTEYIQNSDNKMDKEE